MDQFTVRLHEQNSNQRLTKYAIVQLYLCSSLMGLSIWYHIQRPTLSQHLVPTDTESPAAPQISQIRGHGKKKFRR